MMDQGSVATSLLQTTLLSFNGHTRRECLPDSNHPALRLIKPYNSSGLADIISSVVKTLRKRRKTNCIDELKYLCKQGQLKQALSILESMGNVKDSDIFAYILQACTIMQELAQGKLIHAYSIKASSKETKFLTNNVVNMYVNCGSLVDAELIFNTMPRKNNFTWTVIIAGCTKNKQPKKALAYFRQMKEDGMEANTLIFVVLLGACISYAATETGKWLHACILKTICHLHLFVGNSLIDMYAKCGCIAGACDVFQRMQVRDVVSYNALITGYAQHHARCALGIFRQMQEEGLEPSKATFLGLLSACVSLSSIGNGKLIHNQIKETVFLFDITLGSMLIDMYAKCGSINGARQVFDEMPCRDLVSWTAIIAGYARHGEFVKAQKILIRMDREGISPSNVTFMSILSQCDNLDALELGIYIHLKIKEAGLESDVVIGSAVVDMYAKCGRINDAREAFGKLVNHDLVSWTAMIAAYAEQGDGLRAIELFEHMQSNDIKPSKVTFISILSACASVAALDHGICIHKQIKAFMLDADAFVASALIDMYARCGCIEQARLIFDLVRVRDLVIWSAMIAGYAQHGDGQQILKLFHKMQAEGIKADEITFVSLLNACSHAGLMNEGYHNFCLMGRDYAIKIKEDHIACMVDLLGRMGHLDEAYDCIGSMLAKPNIIICISFLCASRLYGDVRLVDAATNSILNLD